MNTKLMSVQKHCMRPSNREIHDEETSSHLNTNSRQDEPVERASQSFQSLVSFVKEGKNLTNHATTQACILLGSLSGEISDDVNLYRLVPSPDGSCSGFTESMSLLLTSSNETIVKAAWWLLTFTIAFASEQGRMDFLAAGFFSLFPTEFYQQKIHLSTKYGSYLIDVVKDCMKILNPSKMRDLDKKRPQSKDSFEEIFMNKFIHPIKPFLDSVCKNRRLLRQTQDSFKFTWLLETMMEFTPFLEGMTQFVLSSPFAITYTDCLHFIEDDSALSHLLRGVVRNAHMWKKEDPAVRRRKQQILDKMVEDGLLDEIELHFQCRNLTHIQRISVSLIITQIHYLGQNAPYLFDSLR
ncbi:hypothetical protein BLNAU_1050 [Blattamonas nauphoetae]|uniref:Uncharacterized protein n=1 Tax=Blattamonas nauphoetae TaxID=2049346 RepID=A0ABQ9YJP5_9EUKA|nr:hypothetical protein BLNAU_1050 [Blattamonas nauphoetae]